MRAIREKHPAPPTEHEKDIIGRVCANCGAIDDLQYHHIIPVTIGGRNVITNYVCLCGHCHDILHGIQHKDGHIDHNKLIKAGITKAQARGVKVGRPNADHENVMRLIAEKSTQFNADSLTTECEIMEEAKVKSVCYHKCKRMLLDAMKREKWPFTWHKPEQIRNRPLYECLILKRRREANEAKLMH